MYDNASPGKESRGYDRQPARIVLQNGETFDVIHHDRTADNRWVFAYVHEHAGGIDYRFPSEAVLYIDTASDDSEWVDSDTDLPTGSEDVVPEEGDLISELDGSTQYAIRRVGEVSAFGTVEVIDAYGAVTGTYDVTDVSECPAPHCETLVTHDGECESCRAVNEVSR